jgi:FdhD protein
MSEVRITRVSGGSEESALDEVVVEEPLEIRVGEKAVSVTMRTPGHDFDLALGFLFTESIVASADDVESIRHWGSPNVVRFDMRAGVTLDLQRLQRHFYSTSSCGVCGKSSIDALRVNAKSLASPLQVPASVIETLPSLLRAQQKTFDSTGGIHAAGICDANGEMLVVREDIGRHNAVDKAIGALLRERRAMDQCALVVSGRTSFEIVQKCVVAQIPMLVAVGAASSLAIELAREFGLTLIGFAREGRFNVYWP